MFKLWLGNEDAMNKLLYLGVANLFFYQDLTYKVDGALQRTNAPILLLFGYEY
jgi:hypothetical protein